MMVHTERTQGEVCSRTQPGGMAERVDVSVDLPAFGLAGVLK